ncbi:putative aminopeptidase W07G4.4 [Copidosoma floridanum]|uniref:putative aminopeptidase W07G4.4 n=1 Tax=Copidosoma floridanum TaxID=29053 RepID=UPI0006C9A642|nr:putative aminopeptidase W07G4.4 [Copidosoma floridanum]
MSAGLIGLLTLRRATSKLWNLESCCKCVTRVGHFRALSSRAFLLSRLQTSIGWTGTTLRSQSKAATYYSYYSYSTVTTYIPTELKIVKDLKESSNYDGIVLISGTPPGEQEPEPFKSILSTNAQMDSGLFENGAVLPIDLPPKRFVYSPTGPMDPDYDDVRVYTEAAMKGMKRALKAGMKSPLLILLPDTRYKHTELVTLLGALEALYVPLEVREISDDRTHKAKYLGIWSPIDSKKLETIVKLATALESGRYVARDIGGSDPERMAPPKIEEYIQKLFKGTSIDVQVTSDRPTLEKEYPLFAAVDRAASTIPRHAGRVVYLTYEPTDAKETIMLVGKGVTMDTGGLNIKTGNKMTSMSRDKCGAASAAGFMQTVNLLKPSGTKVMVGLALVRNSVGENAYVVDEVITARSGARVRVGNTDAEGRFAMADLLCRFKELAVKEVNPHLLTIATLTGHAQASAGIGYSIAMDNSVARSANNAYKLQESGESLADPFEVSIIRKEDLKSMKGEAEGIDVLQIQKNSDEGRGHQSAGAFLVLASGLKKHDVASEKPLKYTHLDIAGSAAMDMNKNVNAVTICALAKHFFEKMFE